jgi:plastocyanin
VTKTKNKPFAVPEVKRSRTGNNLCQCLVPQPEGYIDDEMIEQGYSDDTHRFYTLGCGKHCSNRFAQGHDAKLKSELIRAYRDNVEMCIDTGGMLLGTDAVTMADQLGWLHFMTSKATPARFRPKKDVPVGIVVLDNVGQEISVGDTVEFTYRGRQTQAMITSGMIEGERQAVTVAWKNAKGEDRTHTVDADRVVLIEADA